MQTLVNIALGLGLAGTFAAVIVLAANRPDSSMDEASLRAIVAEIVTEQQAGVPVAGADLDAAIESYLLENPRILQDVSTALETELRSEEVAATRVALASLQSEIYDDPANIVLGNPDGDVTLVEMFDYNCSFCRQMLPDVLELIAEDPGLRVILKEFPILSAGSVEAARIGVLVNRADVDYARYHTALLSGRGTIDAAAALSAAETLGLNPIALELDMQAADVTETIERTYAIAQALGVSGTPTFIIGNEVIPGAVEKDALAAHIANMRACGEATCDPAEG